MNRLDLPQVKRNSVLLGLLYVAGSLAHLLKEMVLAARFGTSAAMDVFVVAFVLPNLIARFLGGGLNSALVPRAVVWVDREGHPLRPLWDYARRVGLPLVLGACVFGIGLAILAPWLFALLGPGFDSASRTLGTSLLRMLSIAIPASAAAGICLALLHALGRFTLPGASLAATPLVLAGIVLALATTLGVQSITLGFVAGQAVLLLVLSAQLRWVARSTRSDGGAGPDAAVVRTTFAAAVLVLAGWAGGMLNIVVDWLMASTLDSGRVAALRFSFQVMSIPIDLFSAAAGVALLPALSRAVQDRDGEAERRTMVYAMRLLAVLVVPAAAGLAVAARPLVAGLFERQAFDAQATSLTAAALRFYAPGIVFRALMTLWMSHLYAQRRVAVVATIGLGSVVVNAAANWLFMSWLGHVGIALSTTVVHLLAAVLLLMADRRALPLILDVAVGRSWLRAVIAAVVMSVTLWLFTGTSRIEALSPLMEMFLVVSCGAASFAASLALLRGGELGEIWKAVRGR